MTGNRRKIEGVSFFSITPTTSGGDIDFAAWKTLVDAGIAAGVHNLTIFGSTGSNGFFTEEEKRKSLTTIVAHVAGRIPVMFGVGALTTAESERLTRFASENGADAVLAVPITYWKPTHKELLEHYKAIDAASGVPVWVYNNPPLANVDLTPAFMVELAESSRHLVGMKDSSGDLTRIFRVPLMTGGKVAVGLGQDVIPVEPLLGPAPCWFTGLANFCPGECVALWTAAKSGDANKAYALARRLFAISEIGGRYGIVRVAHTALDILGRFAGAPRRPLRNLEGAAREELKGALEALGLM